MATATPNPDEEVGEDPTVPEYDVDTPPPDPAPAPPADVTPPVAVVAPGPELPPDVPVNQNTGVTPEPNPDPLGVFTPAVGSVEDRLTALEKKVDIIGKTADLIAQGQVNAALQAQAADVPDTAHYVCSKCVEEGTVDPTTGEAIVYEFVHPAKWYSAMGAIQCPLHPGQPELMTCIEMRDQMLKQDAQRQAAILAATTARPTPLPAPGGEFAGTPPPPPPLQPAAVA